MKKNLKKVISAVLSLTLALSSFVALSATTSAATFSDVADTANYSEAVEALAALGVISGYEDGTFLPNNTITRAEAITMVVGALNMSEDAKNSGTTSQFADVNAEAAWAAGYVNVGVAQNFISGVSATEFAPKSNVTYNQILVMLTRILGYGDFAESRGGYNDGGYLTAAATAGILSGVSAAKDDDMTRAQVAQLIWNAIQAPMLDITTFSTSASQQEMQKMDGNNGRGFRTVLSQYFDAYVLNVTIDATSQSKNYSTPNLVDMKITASNDWDAEYEVLLKNYGTAIAASKALKTEVDAGATVATDYLFSSAKVIAEYVDDDWTLLYFAPTAKVATKAIDGSLAAGYNTAYTELNVLKSKTTSSTTTYKLSTNDAGTAPAVEVYVNGTKFADLSSTNAAEVLTYIKGASGDVTLVEDVNASNRYNKIMINYYVFARVSQVNVSSGSTKITLGTVKAPETTLSIAETGATITVDHDELETGEVVVNVTKAGAAAELSSLAKDDVIAVKYDIGTAGATTNKKTISDSSVIEILATNDTVVGKFTGYDSTEDLYTVAGTEYESTAPITVGNAAGNLTVGTTYTFKLDPMGNLFTYEEEATAKNFAIVERYATAGTANNSGEYDLIQIVTFDGQTKTLYVDTDSEGAVQNVMNTMQIKTTVDLTAAGDSNANPAVAPVAIKDRIIEYTVRNSTGRVRSVTPVTGSDIVVYEGTGNDVEFNSATNRLGKALSSTATVLDATDYVANITDAAVKNKVSDYQASSLSALTDGVKYEAILVHKNNSNEYNNVIVTRAGSIFGATSNFAVAADGNVSTAIVDDDEEVNQIYVMDNGSDEAVKLNVSQSVKVYYAGSAAALTDVTEGSVFYYTTDSDGYVNKIAIVYKADGTKTKAQNFAALYSAVSANMANTLKAPFAGGANDYDGQNSSGDTNWLAQLAEVSGVDTSIQLVLAPVFLANDKSVTVAEIKNDSTNGNYMDTNATHDYTINDETKIYAYDMSTAKTGRNAFTTGAFIGFDSSDCDANGKAWLGQVAKPGTSPVEYEYNHAQTVQMAIMMVVDGTVTNALVMQNF